MSSSSNYSLGHPLLEGEITLINKGSTSSFDHGDEVSSPKPFIVTAPVIISSRVSITTLNKCKTKLKGKGKKVASHAPKSKHKDCFIPIRDARYTWILNEVASYIYDFTLIEKVVEFAVTFDIYQDGLVALPLFPLRKSFHGSWGWLDYLYLCLWVLF